GQPGQRARTSGQLRLRPLRWSMDVAQHMAGQIRAQPTLSRLLCPPRAADHPGFALRPGLRMFAGWAAGLAPMEWQRFLVFNFLGAALWVTALSLAGWTLGGHWRRLLRWLGRLD